MQKRLEIAGDYLQLRVLLNRTNPLKNQQTEIVFHIEIQEKGAHFLAALDYRSSKQLELCRKPRLHKWQSSNCSSLIYLEDFCADFLQTHLPNPKDQNKQAAVLALLKQQLSSLLIPKI